MHIPIFAVEEAANFKVPLVTCVAGLFFTVEVIVSTEFAVRYVPPYTRQINANGFEKTRECGRRRNDVKEVLSEFLSVA